MSSAGREAPDRERLDRERLSRLLGDSELEWLLARVRRRIELGKPLEGIVTLQDASPSQRLAVKRLLGWPPKAGRALRVSLQAVDEVVRCSGASPDGLAAAVTALTGPVVVRKEAIAAERRAWDIAFEPLTALVRERLAAEGRFASEYPESGRFASEYPESGRFASESCDSSRLVSWLERLRGSGVVKRMQDDPLRAGELLRQLAGVIAELPSEGEPLGAFAARVAGSAHALDDGEPLAALALGAVRALAGLHDLGVDESPAQSRREAWAAVGLLCDELSSAVLALGLPGEESTGTGRLLELARSDGQPIWLTLRQLVRDPPAWDGVGAPEVAARGRLPDRGLLADQTVHICENPVVVALAADRLGGKCRPLVCTSGQPGAATITVLRRLAGAGAKLVHHGDFDWGGIRIGNALYARLAASSPAKAQDSFGVEPLRSLNHRVSLKPWRFDAQTYRRLTGASRSSAGSASAHRARALGDPLLGRPVPASWDFSLMEAMLDLGQRIEEENVVEELLADLSQ